MTLNQGYKEGEALVSFDIQDDQAEEVISLKDCEKILSEFDLPEDQILLIRDTVIGITNGIINTYVDELN